MKIDLTFPKKNHRTIDYLDEQADMFRFKSNVTFVCYLLLVPTLLILFLFGLTWAVFTGNYIIPDLLFTKLLTYLAYLLFFTPLLINFKFFIEIVSKGVLIKFNQLFYWLEVLNPELKFRFDIVSNKHIIAKILTYIFRVIVAILSALIYLFFALGFALLMRLIYKKMSSSNYILPNIEF